MRWIGPPRDVGDQVVLSHRFESSTIRSARLFAVADFCDAQFEINGKRIAARRAYEDPVEVDVANRLRDGWNELRVAVRPVDGPTAVCLRLDLELADGTRRTIVSDDTWQLVKPDAEPRPVTTYGEVAPFPYGDRETDITISPLDDYTQWKRAQGDAAATSASTFDLPDGFEIELVHAATEDEGSWVAMTFDRQGRAIVAREKRGLLRLTIPEEPGGGDVQVEVVDDTLRECRGLAFVGKDLYAMVNVDHALYRLRDSNADDQFDERSKVATFDGDNGHGRNQVTIGPNGDLYGIFGDSVFESKDAAALPATLANPTPAERTRSGFLARFDPRNDEWEIVVRGLRNPYGVAFNAHGDAFTYDADAEYDMGSPWYRPTRVVQLVPGGDFGWRRVTRQWPPYDPDRPDTPRPTLDIGKGSPTAVAFGYGTNFPPRYRKALFALDWAYGRILAVHLSPRGSGYVGRAEVFLRGRPANVTDLAVGPGGAMYFVTGGRGTQSALYRVKSVGEAVEPSRPTQQQRDREVHALEARERRRLLESHHGTPLSKRARVWPMLGTPDPWQRHATRVVLEHTSAERWAEQALAQSNPTVAAEGLLALSRVGSKEHRPRIVKRIGELGLGDLPIRERLTLLYVLDRCLGDDPPESLAKEALAIVDPLYPGESPEWNRQASLFLERLAAPHLAGRPAQATSSVPRFVERTLPLLLAAQSQEERLHYLFVLRNIREGWTAGTRRAYFEQLRRFDEFVGGEGMPTFRQRIRTAALESVPESEREEYESILERAVTTEDVPTRTKIVHEWTFAELSKALPDMASGRDFASGRRAFGAAKCSACHRVEGRGGVLGPDLATVSRRFAPRDVLVSILEPSKVVSEKYRPSTYVLADGRVFTGRPLPGDYRAAELSVSLDPLDATKVVTFPKSAVEEHRVSPKSPMPEGLLNVLTADEVLDLLAYLQSGGDGRHPAFGAPKAGGPSSER